jgi:hypothetical protein
MAVLYLRVDAIVGAYPTNHEIRKCLTKDSVERLKSLFKSCVKRQIVLAKDLRRLLSLLLTEELTTPVKCSLAEYFKFYHDHLPTRLKNPLIVGCHEPYNFYHSSSLSLDYVVNNGEEGYNGNWSLGNAYFDSFAKSGIFMDCSNIFKASFGQIAKVMKDDHVTMTEFSQNKFKYSKEMGADFTGDILIGMVLPKNVYKCYFSISCKFKEDIPDFDCPYWNIYSERIEVETRYVLPMNMFNFSAIYTNVSEPFQQLFQDYKIDKTPKVSGLRDGNIIFGYTRNYSLTVHMFSRSEIEEDNLGYCLMLFDYAPVEKTPPYLHCNI